MLNKDLKSQFLAEVKAKLGQIKKLERTQSLYEIGDGAARIYIRYSRVHKGDRTFYGLRAEDLRQLEGRPAFICFLWNGQETPLLLPFNEYEDVFHAAPPAPDGQYKVQVYIQDEGRELYIARAGRFNVEAHFGLTELVAATKSSRLIRIPDLSHSQVQTMLGAIGDSKDFDIWIPPNDRGKLDWNLGRRFDSRDMLPQVFSKINEIIQGVDVIWLSRGSSQIRALFEVEHSTPVYSGLLRFNDIHLSSPSLHPRFTVVSNDSRRSIFVKQLARPTFITSGLSDLCTFLDYRNVYEWHGRVAQRKPGDLS